MKSGQTPRANVYPIKGRPWRVGTGFGIAIVVLGGWLIISAFAGPHNLAVQTNTWLVGVILIAAGAAQLRGRQAAWLSGAAAAWLFVWSVILPLKTVASGWCNTLVALSVVMLSFAFYRLSK